MILYEANYADIVLRWNGTVMPDITQLAIWFTVMASVAFYKLHEAGAVGFMEVEQGKAPLASVLAKFVAFLVVFRANQGLKRYWQGRTLLSDIFMELRECAMCVTVWMRGGAAQRAWLENVGKPGWTMERKLGLEDDDDRLLTEARVAIIRALLACAVGVKLMTRIAREGWQFGEVCP